MKFSILLLLTATLGFAQEKTDAANHCIVEKSKTAKTKTMKSNQKNVLGIDLIVASIDPLTGFFRTGFCETDSSDRGVHVVAAVVTDAFLKYSLSKGNDLISPYPPSGFPGLKAGDVWCLCALRWKEALKAGFAPPVILEATNRKALEFVSMEELKANQVK
uniref:DUF2237 family protein n=1 Tax=Flavobacterium sp. TaxID=239 RepID=UPI004049F4F6